MNELAGSTKKSYRAPRRRPARLRTKTGCIPCRERKKKCDEAPGACQSCLKRRIQCVWPVTTSTRCSALVSATSVYGQIGEAPLSFSSFARWGPPYSGCERSLTSDEDTHWVVPASTSSPSLLPEHRISGNLATNPSTASIHDALLFDYMRSVFVPQLIRPTADQQSVQDFTTTSLQLAFAIPFHMDALLACSGAELSTASSLVHRRLAQSHYTKAVAGLRTYLTDNGWQQADSVALRTVILLCIYERSRVHLSNEVNTHLNGAAAIVTSWCNRATSSNYATKVWDELSILCIEAFVFHAATTVPFQNTSSHDARIDEAFLAAQTLLRKLEEEGVFTPAKSRIFGTPSSLFTLVRQASLLYRSSRGKHSAIHNCLRLKHRLDLWCHENRQFLITEDEETRLEYPTSSGEEEVQENGLLLLPRSIVPLGPSLYVLAIQILLSRLTPHLQGTIKPTSALLCRAMALIDRLDPSVDYFADYYCWPFWYVGICLTNNEDRDVLFGKIMAFRKATRNGPMGRLAHMLSAEWGDTS